MFNYAKIELAPPTFREVLMTPGLIGNAVRQDFAALTPKASLSSHYKLLLLIKKSLNPAIYTLERGKVWVCRSYAQVF